MAELVELAQLSPGIVALILSAINSERLRRLSRRLEAEA